MVTFEHLDHVRAGNAGVRFPDAGRYVSAMAEAIRKDPIVLDWARGESKLGRVHRPLHVIAEQRFWAFRIATETNLEGFAEFTDGMERSEVEARAALITAMLSASPFLWLNDIRATAVASPVPAHVVSRSVLPMPLMWWSYETGIAITSGGRRATVDAELYYDVPDGIQSLMFGAWDDTHISFISGGAVPYGARYPDDVPDVGPFLSALSFLNSPYIDRSPERLTRAERKRVERCGPVAPLPDVCVIRLRAGQSGRRDRGASTVEGREWSHRWLVRGHHRAQWYPSEQAHRVIWIAPYIKGPEDKPFHQPLYAVTR